MKKLISAVMCLLICLSLSSCKELDELRDKHAFFNNRSIMYDDKLYKVLVTYEGLNFNFAGAEYINVTDPDVPVLLSETFNFHYYINDDKTIIHSDYYDEWYVREDKYSEFENKIKNGVNYSEVGFEYYNASLGDDDEYILNESEKKTFMSLMEGKTVSENFEVYQELFLFEQSSDRLFRHNDYYVVMRTDKGYYIRVNINRSTDEIYKSNDAADKMFDAFFETANGNFADFRYA